MKKNFSALKKFEADLKALEQNKDIFMRQMAKELARIFEAKVRKRTPVSEGIFIVVGKYKRGKKKGMPILEKETGGGKLRAAWHTTDIIKHRNYYLTSVLNNMEYASYVENGHRQRVGRYVPVLGKTLKKNFVEGQHMMKLSAELIEKEGAEYLQNQFYEFLRRHFDA